MIASEEVMHLWDEGEWRDSEKAAEIAAREEGGKQGTTKNQHPEPGPGVGKLRSLA